MNNETDKKAYKIAAWGNKNTLYITKHGDGCALVVITHDGGATYTTAIWQKDKYIPIADMSTATLVSATSNQLKLKINVPYWNVSIISCGLVDYTTENT